MAVTNEEGGGETRRTAKKPFERNGNQVDLKREREQRTE